MLKSNGGSVVVVSHAQDLDYRQDCVALPRAYGTPAWFARPDVQALRAVVFENLLALDEATHFTEQIRDRKVIVKPNLVTVFHNLGTRERDYPESTDPRVIDALIEFLQDYSGDITIAESSGRGLPTRLAFHVSGLERLARFRGVRLVALEEQPTDRYLLPRARVMREVVVPRLFSQVVRGEAFYISIPKMKTNLYTGVTLGFKNAMGVLSYNLRQRNHNHALEQKLVDMLHLFRADLTLIDGIVGGEGNCPAPVEPVQSRVIVSGNHSVETDRVAIRMMGIDPETIPLMRVAGENGFGDPSARVIGEPRVTPYRPADPSLLGGWMQAKYPNVKVLIGHNLRGAPVPDENGCLCADGRCSLEATCRGGCQASVRYAFDMLFYEGQRRDFALVVLIGAGTDHRGQPLYYDGGGRHYTPAEIAALPGKKLAVGTCARPLAGMVDRLVDGCMPFPNAPHAVIHALSGTTCAVTSLRNRYLLQGLLASLRVLRRRKALIRTGERIDIPLAHADKIYETREFSEDEQQQAYIYEPFAPLSPDEIEALCAEEDRAFRATFQP